MAPKKKATGGAAAAPKGRSSHTSIAPAALHSYAASLAASLSIRSLHSLRCTAPCTPLPPTDNKSALYRRTSLLVAKTSTSPANKRKRTNADEEAVAEAEEEVKTTQDNGSKDTSAEGAEGEEGQEEKEGKDDEKETKKPAAKRGRPSKAPAEGDDSTESSSGSKKPTPPSKEDAAKGGRAGRGRPKKQTGEGGAAAAPKSSSSKKEKKDSGKPTREQPKRATKPIDRGPYYG